MQTPALNPETAVCDEMLTSRQRETVPAVDNPRHLRKTHGVALPLTKVIGHGAPLAACCARPTISLEICSRSSVMETGAIGREPTSQQGFALELFPMQCGGSRVVSRCHGRSRPVERAPRAVSSNVPPAYFHADARATKCLGSAKYWARDGGARRAPPEPE